MKDKFYVTREINESFDMRLINNIQTLIDTLEVDTDYLQVFDLSGNTLIHSQEEPEYSKEYQLSKKYKDGKLFCIRTDEENSRYWTLMFAHEY